MVVLSYGAKGERNVNRAFNSLIKKMGEKDKALKPKQDKVSGGK